MYVCVRTHDCVWQDAKGHRVGGWGCVGVVAAVWQLPGSCLLRGTRPVTPPRVQAAHPQSATEEPGTVRGKGTVPGPRDQRKSGAGIHVSAPPSPPGWEVLLRPMGEFAQRRPSGFSLTPAGTAPLGGKCSRGAGEQKSESLAERREAPLLTHTPRGGTQPGLGGLEGQGWWESYPVPTSPGFPRPELGGPSRVLGAARLSPKQGGDRAGSAVALAI